MAPIETTAPGIILRYVDLARRGRLPAPRQTPVLSAKKGEAPRLLILDLNAWIELGRAHFADPRNRARPGAVEALQAIRAGIAGGSLVLPVTGMNLIEALRVGRKDRLRRLASFMVELSGNISMTEEVQLP